MGSASDISLLAVSARQPQDGAVRSPTVRSNEPDRAPGCLQTAPGTQSDAE